MSKIIVMVEMSACFFASSASYVGSCKYVGRQTVRFFQRIREYSPIHQTNGVAYWSGTRDLNRQVADGKSAEARIKEYKRGRHSGRPLASSYC